VSEEHTAGLQDNLAVCCLEFEEIPTSGYRWCLNGLPEEVTLESDSFDSDDSSIGGGGRYRFHLVATRAGTYTFFAELAQPWDGEPISRRTIVLTITALDQ
jgi:predicted secreted protein